MNLKSVILLTAFISIITIDSFAVTGRDSWNDIKKSGDVMILQPTFAGIFGPEGLFNACTTDDEFKSIIPVKNCIEYNEVLRQSEHGLYKDYDCTTYETKHVSIDRTLIQNVCLKHTPMNKKNAGRCYLYNSITKIYPTTFSFAVIDASENNYGNLLFLKTFALQSCD